MDIRVSGEKSYRDGMHVLSIFEKGNNDGGTPTYFVGWRGYSGRVIKCYIGRDGTNQDITVVRNALDAYAKSHKFPVVGQEDDEYVTSQVFISVYDALVVRLAPTDKSKWSIYKMGTHGEVSEFPLYTEETNTFDSAQDAYRAIFEYTASCYGDAYNMEDAVDGYLDSIIPESNEYDFHNIFETWIMYKLSTSNPYDILGSMSRVEKLIPQFKDSYIGQWNSKGEFAHERMAEDAMVNEQIDIDKLPPSLLNNVNWDGVADEYDGYGYTILDLHDNGRIAAFYEE